MGFFRKIILFSAIVLIALGGYFVFISTEAPNFFLLGDLKNNAILLFGAGGFLILIWIIIGSISKSSF